MKYILIGFSCLMFTVSSLDANVPKYCKPHGCCVDKCPCVKKCLCDCSCKRKK